MMLQQNKVYVVVGFMIFTPALYASQFNKDNYSIAEANVSSVVNDEAQANAQHKEQYSKLITDPKFTYALKCFGKGPNYDAFAKEIYEIMGIMTNIVAVDQLRKTTFDEKNQKIKTDLKAVQDAQNVIKNYNNQLAHEVYKEVAQNYLWGFQWLAWYITNPCNHEFQKYHAHRIEDYAVQCEKHYSDIPFMNVIISTKKLNGLHTKKSEDSDRLESLKAWQPDASIPLADGEQERFLRQYYAGNEAETIHEHIGSYDQNSRTQLQDDGIKKLFDRLS